MCCVLRPRYPALSHSPAAHPLPLPLLRRRGPRGAGRAGAVGAPAAAGAGGAACAEHGAVPHDGCALRPCFEARSGRLAAASLRPCFAGRPRCCAWVAVPLVVSFLLLACWNARLNPSPPLQPPSLCVQRARATWLLQWPPPRPRAASPTRQSGGQEGRGGGAHTKAAIPQFGCEHSQETGVQPVCLACRGVVPAPPALPLFTLHRATPVLPCVQLAPCCPGWRHARAGGAGHAAGRRPGPAGSRLLCCVGHGRPRGGRGRLATPAGGGAPRSSCLLSYAASRMRSAWAQRRQ